jgi:hypothetical protein
MTWCAAPRPIAAAALLLGLCALCGESSCARAEEVEVREFSVLVDGKPCGTYRMTITRKDEHTLTMSCQAEVRVKVALITAYRYSYNGVEVWKDGRLQSLQSACNDDGKRSVVTATLDGKRLRVKVNGQEGDVRPDVWLTTFWSLPDARQRSGAIPLLDADTGRYMDGQIQFVGTSTVHAAGQALTCSHYRVTSQSPHDVWFDSSERMVRQDWVEDGHRTCLILTRVQR